MTGLQPAGLPHSEISGSIVICTSPELIAAYHVLLRLREPRHPPSALAYFLFPCTYSPSGMCRIDISLKLALFLLLYCFVVHHVKDLLTFALRRPVFVENNGFEPLTLCVQGRCSSQLS